MAKPFTASWDWRGALGAVAILLADPGRGGAQTQAPAAPTPALEDQSPVISELDVVARRPGPAMWRVTRGQAQVIILGGLSPLPHSLQWDTVRVQHALDGAAAVYLPANRPQLGLLDAASMFFRQGALKPQHGRDMEEGLSPELRARFDRVRDSFHADPKRYRHWKPLVAGLLLLGDFWKAAGLSEDKPASTVARMAREVHVDVHRVGEFRAKPLFDGAAAMSDAQNQICLSAALDEIELEAGHARPAADAWAKGDLADVRANSAPLLFDQCFQQFPSVQSLLSHGADLAVQTIDHALERPGRSVAVIDLNFLLRKDGVLDRLKAQGDQISVPTD